MFQRLLAATTGLFVALAFAGSAMAGVTVYKKDNKTVSIGARLQLQYHRADPDGGESTDDLFFRRLRPYIEGSVTENWTGKFQFDLGKADGDNELAVKDAFLRYKGWDAATITIGNAKPWFSREFMTSSKRQQLVERTFVGDHNYGSPDRALGLHLNGTAAEKKVEWGVSFGSEFLDPDAKKLDFDTPVNRASDWNEGWLLSGRLDFHPLGQLKKEQGDFARETKFTVSVAAFTWSNDDDNNTHTQDGVSTSSSKPDVDSANGFELSAALRTGGFSVDAQYNLISSDTVDSAFTGGLYHDGTTDLDIFAVEGGYMFGQDFEIVGGYESLDADNYTDAWTRTSFGVNYFWNKYKVKAQLTYRMNENRNGSRGSDEDELFLQMQYVF